MSFSLNQLPSQVPSANPTADVLAEHARAIRELAARTRENIIAIGRHLTEVRDQIEPGEWLAWLEAEFGWSDQTARRFMHVYGLSRDARLNTCVELDLPLHVLYCLAAPKAEDARQEIADRIAAGEEVTRETVEEAIARIRQKVGRSKRPSPRPRPATRCFRNPLIRAPRPARSRRHRGRSRAAENRGSTPSIMPR